MMEKAQDNKKKHNLEVNQGKALEKPLNTCKDSFVNLAPVIGIVSGDGDPISQSMLDSMLELEQSRVTNFEKLSKQKDSAKVVDPQADPECSKDNVVGFTGQSQSSGEVRESKGGCPNTPSGSQSQPIVIDDDEKGWTEVKVGRRRKKSKR